MIVDRKDRHREYTGKIFKYKYPFTWKKRNLNYLEIIPDRDFEEEQDYMFPCDKEDDRYYNGK